MIPALYLDPATTVVSLCWAEWDLLGYISEAKSIRENKILFGLRFKMSSANEIA
jgi:hypothetical protein